MSTTTWQRLYDYGRKRWTSELSVRAGGRWLGTVAVFKAGDALYRVTWTAAGSATPIPRIIGSEPTLARAKERGAGYADAVERQALRGPLSGLGAAAFLGNCGRPHGQPWTLGAFPGPLATASGFYRLDLDRLEALCPYDDCEVERRQAGGQLRTVARRGHVYGYLQRAAGGRDLWVRASDGQLFFGGAFTRVPSGLYLESDEMRRAGLTT